MCDIWGQTLDVTLAAGSWPQGYLGGNHQAAAPVDLSTFMYAQQP